ncbi:hypothetical protein F3Y22_tig00110392pilonHSYRG00132 [Hibiscus syriacus]|uniref:Uncharacterized protein n=1 Tax=Hibiscus syriacus TaxID=106335 RepID=A0A6A3APG0_HIBSY|nr:hypothetical protein F3Y22_tig00110392pilonHSYRG00132 [Hibiscus syriacus]
MRMCGELQQRFASGRCYEGYYFICLRPRASEAQSSGGSTGFNQQIAGGGYKAKSNHMTEATGYGYDCKECG